MWCGLILLLLLQPFYGPLSGTTRVSRYQKKRSSAHLSWSSSNLCQLLPSTTIHSILPIQITCLTIFLHNLFPCPLWRYLLVWSRPHHIPYITSPNQCLLFAAHAHNIAACFAVVSILYHPLINCKDYDNRWIYLGQVCTHQMFFLLPSQVSKPVWACDIRARDIWARDIPLAEDSADWACDATSVASVPESAAVAEWTLAAAAAANDAGRSFEQFFGTCWTHFSWQL